MADSPKKTLQVVATQEDHDLLRLFSDKCNIPQGKVLNVLLKAAWLRVWKEMREKSAAYRGRFDLELFLLLLGRDGGTISGPEYEKALSIIMDSQPGNYNLDAIFRKLEADAQNWGEYIDGDVKKSLDELWANTDENNGND